MSTTSVECLTECMLHGNLMAVIAFRKQKSLRLIGLFTIIWQRFWWCSSYWTANCSSWCMGRWNIHPTWWSGNILIVIGWSCVTRSINQRQHDRVQVTVGPWVSQSLTRPILTAVKYIRKIVTRTKIEQRYSTFQFIVTTFCKRLSYQNWSGHSLTGLTSSYGPAWICNVELLASYSYYVIVVVVS